MAARLCFADSLIFYESFENQDSLNANDCISCAASSFNPGIIGSSAYFSSGSLLTYPVLNNIDKNKGTLSIWVKPSSLSVAGGFFDYGGLGTYPSFGIFKPTANEVHFETRTDENTHRNQFAANAFKVNNWTNIVIAWRTNNATSLTRLYVNGNIVSDWSYPSFNFTPVETFFTIGQTGYYGVANAYLDELKIYDYIRSTGEIKQDYNDVIGYSPPNFTSIKPQSKGPVKINTSGLFVNNKSFFIKGVGYQPTPICKTYGYDFFSHPEIYTPDFGLLREMNANTIRTWANVNNENFLNAAYNNGNKPIYVAMGFWIPTDNIDYGDPATIETYKTQFRGYVRQYKNNSAVLLWAVGNENNLHYSGDKTDWYYLSNELAKVAYIEEGEYYHPVAVVNGDLGYIGDSNYLADDLSLNYTDIWGINAYRGYSFVSFFDEYKWQSSKPLWIAEFGIDALDNTIKEEYEETQAEWDLNMWNDIANSDITIGGTVMEYSDEWQKDWTINDPCNQTKYCAYATPNHPDGCSNEEWYGIVRAKSETNLSNRTKRLVYYAFQSAFAESQTFNLGLFQGWNLISIPLSIPGSVESIFGTSKIYGYNGSWFIPKYLDPMKGYWLESNSSHIIPISGAIATDSINLDNGWNLVGFPGLEEKPVAEEYVSNLVYSYNSTWSSYIPAKTTNSLHTLKPGLGYWVKND